MPKMTSAQSKKQKLSGNTSVANDSSSASSSVPNTTDGNRSASTMTDSKSTLSQQKLAAAAVASATQTNNASLSNNIKRLSNNNNNNNHNSSSGRNGNNHNTRNMNIGVGDVDDLTDESDESEGDDDEDDDDDDEDDDDDGLDESDMLNGSLSVSSSKRGHMDIQEQLAAAGPAGVAAAAAIATARKRKRPHTFETNPSVRKRQQTRLIRKLRASIDEYTMRVGQQAVVLITMPGKTQHNFKVFGAQPLESVIRACKHEIMAELEQALLDQAPQQFREDTNKHELPPLVIDGIPTPVEKMTQAQLRAFIPLMLKYSTGRGKPGWGKDSTRPLWWPDTLPWANVRSDAREESEKQRISWTTTLRQIVTNCYKYHGRDDLLPTFEENEESLKQQQEQEQQEQAAAAAASNGGHSSSIFNNQQRRTTTTGEHHTRHTMHSRSSRNQHRNDSKQSSEQNIINMNGAGGGGASAHYALSGATIYSTATPTYDTSNFMHTISNPDGTVSLIHLDPSNAQILTLPDGTQVRAVRLQTLGGSEHSLGGQQGVNNGAGAQQLTATELTEAELTQVLNSAASGSDLGGGGGGSDSRQQQHELTLGGQTLALTEASLGPDGQIIVTGEDGVQSCYPMSSLVSIPASMYQQFAQGGQQLSIMTADGQSLSANAVSIHTIQESNSIQQEQQHEIVEEGHTVTSLEENATANTVAVGKGTGTGTNKRSSQEQARSNSASTSSESKSRPKEGAERAS